MAPASLIVFRGRSNRFAAPQSSGFRNTSHFLLMFALDSAGLREVGESLAKDSNHLADGFDTENTGGLLSGLLAEEEDLDRRALWRIGSWGGGAGAGGGGGGVGHQASAGVEGGEKAAPGMSPPGPQN